MLEGASAIEVLDDGRPVAFTFEDMIRFHGRRSQGGVAHAFKVLELALPALGAGLPPERREISIRTAFGGPGARDGFELVTRAVSEDRFDLEPSLALPELGRARERFVFELSRAGEAVRLVLREGFVSEEFIDLARIEEPTGKQQLRLTVLKQEMADRLTSVPAAEVYDLAG